MSEAILAGIYCRISLASTGDTTKTADQERICRELAARLDWKVADGVGYPFPDGVYTDEGKSAWKHNRKRPAWDTMLADAEAGRINAIVVYHNDRLVRQGWDLEVLIRLAEGKGILLASPTGKRSFDNSDDRFVMRIEAAVATRSSDDTSRRKKAGFERMRRNGLTRPGGPGGRCFGFETNGITHVPAETAVIRRAASAVLAGQSLGEVARWISADGVATVAGRRISVQALRRILTYPRIAGLMPDGVSPAAWQPVLDRGDWEDLCAVLALNKALPNAGQGAQHLLSGIARCGADGCGRPLWSGYNGGSPAYKCHSCGRVGRSMALLDAYVASATVALLGRDDNPAGRIPETPGLAAEFAALTEARRELEAVLADHTRGSIPALLDRWDSLNKRLEELRALAGDDARGRLLRKYAGITDDEFDAEPLPVRRSLVAAAFEIVVLPASRRGPGFRKEDVRLTPR